MAKNKTFEEQHSILKQFVGLYGNYGNISLGDFELEVDPRDKYLNVNGVTYFALSETDKNLLYIKMVDYLTK